MEQMLLPIREASNLLSNAERVLVVTGAGVSRASGIPTYRGIGGLYTGRHILPPEFTMSKWCFNWLPWLTWQNFHTAFDRAGQRTWNPAHEAIADMQAITNVTVLTQNVDGFHQDAGSDDVIEIHGSARTFSCSKKCGFQTDMRPKKTNRLPRCPVCGAPIKPDVILFGDNLPRKALDRLMTVLGEENIDLVFIVGTTAVFPYIREACLFNNAPIISVDPNPSEFAKTHATINIELPSEAALQIIVQAAWNELLMRDPSRASTASTMFPAHRSSSQDSKNHAS